MTAPSGASAVTPPLTGGPDPDGVLVIDKPAGPTSHDIVARARRALGQRRVGHTGTLDPFATGVLPLVVGRATRLARFLTGREKAYEAELRLGLTTDTHDATGAMTGGIRLADPAAPLPDAAALVAALAPFRGEQWQQPPAFSAKKVGGVRSYAVARRRRLREDGSGGEERAEALPLAPALVRVDAIDLERLDGDRAVLRMTVSAGFYVRALARDLGERLGCGAHLAALRRTRAGEFGLAEAVGLDEVEREGRAAAARLVPLERLLADWPTLRLTGEGARRVAHGGALTADHLADGAEVPSGPGTLVRLMTADGRLWAIAESRPAGGPARALHPTIVLA